MKKQFFIWVLLVGLCSSLLAQNITLQQTLLYDTDKATLTDVHRKSLQTLIDSVGNAPSPIWEIIGHTDADGTDGYNQRLSDRRASGVEEYLLSKQIPVTAIKRRYLGDFTAKFCRWRGFGGGLGDRMQQIGLANEGVWRKKHQPPEKPDAQGAIPEI